MRAAAALLFLALAAAVCAPRTAAAAVDSYAFTDSACVKGKAFGSKQQSCNLFAGPVLAGDSTNVFVTALSGGVPTEFSSSSTTTVSMAFALSCINPSTHANVRATYAGQSLQLCKANGATPASSEWSGFVNLGFAANAPSASASLVYGDVGKVKLFLRTSTGTISGSGPFVAKPAFLKITSITRVADGFANPKATTGTGTLFAKAGQPLKITAEAQTTGGIAAPNFGSENMILVLDSVPAGGTAEKNSMLAAPKMVGDFASIVGGVSAGSAFSVDEAGIIEITPTLCDTSKPRPCDNSYLDAGPAAATQTVVVGRIYPDHFDTAWVARMACLPHMNCSAGVDGAEYSGHILPVTVTPMNAQGQPLKNFNGVFARAITLSAFTQLGGATPNTAGTLTGNTIALAAIKDPITAGPAFTFPQPFSNTKPQLGTWGVPTAVFVRAESSDAVGGASTISSLRPAAASKEAGVMIVIGRLALANQYGSELAKMPVRAVAQYWTAAKRWEPNISDSVSSLASGGIAFSNCTKALAGFCEGPTLAVSPAGTLPLKDGAATFWLQAPGVGKTGSADFQMNNPADLPSTMGRAVFGIYKSPLIYVREVY